MGEVLAWLKDRKLDIRVFPMPPSALGELLDAVRDGSLSRTAAKRVFDIMLRDGGSAAAIAEREDELADEVNATLIDTTLDESAAAAANLHRSLDAYVDFTEARTAQMGKQLLDELDKLLALRRFLQQLRTVVAAGSLPGLASGAAGVKQ